MARKVLRFPKKNTAPKLSPAESKQRANRMILRRTLVLMLVCGILAFIPLVVTLYKLMIVEHDYYETLAINN